MDSNALERERGITIMAKNTSIVWGDTRINIVDTPGHSDFGGEVERTLSMVDGILLLVDACEGPLPQTRFVLKKALEAGLSAILCINKIDRADARTAEVLDEVYDLFIDLGANEDQLDFPILYTNARVGYRGYASSASTGEDLQPLFEAIISHLPGPEVDPDATLQFQANNLDYDDYVGRLAIGRVVAGSIEAGGQYTLCQARRHDRASARSRDLYAMAGAEAGRSRARRGGRHRDGRGPRRYRDRRHDRRPRKSAAAARHPHRRADRRDDFFGQQLAVGRTRGAVRHLAQARRAHRSTNRAAMSASASSRSAPMQWRVMGRGELQLAVIVETMRREGYELQVSKPTVVTKQKDGAILEPMEFLVIDIPEDCIGIVTQLLSARKGRMRTMVTHASGRVRLEYDVPARGLIGFRGRFLPRRAAPACMHSIFNGYVPWAATSARGRTAR